MNHSKKIEPRFIAGPPGTGKTHGFIVGLYKDLLPKYHPDKIVILSHTNVAANQIRDAILQIPEIKERGFTQKSMKYKICTIHSYCRNRLLRKEKVLLRHIYLKIKKLKHRELKLQTLFRKH